MKKFIVALIVLFIMIPSFTMDVDITTVSAIVASKVKPNQPRFSLLNLSTLGDIRTEDGVKSIKDLLVTDVDIPTRGVEIDFNILQKEDTLYHGIVTVQILTSSFKGSNGKSMAGQPTLDNIVILNNNKEKGVSIVYQESENTFSFNYKGLEEVKAGKLGSFTVSWPGDTNKQSDTYSADVSFICSVQ